MYDNAIELYKAENSPLKGELLLELELPPPVYFCKVEPNSEAEEKRLHYALECLQREDPSMRVLFNDEENFGQTIVQGMGELHLEIIKNRIFNEYKLKAYFGPLNIAYKEQPTLDVSECYSLSKIANEKKVNVTIELSLVHKKNFRFNKVDVEIKNKGKGSEETISQEHLNAINYGISSALNKGKQD